MVITVFVFMASGHPEGKIHSCSEVKMVRKAVDVQEAVDRVALCALGLVVITVPLLKI